MPSGVYRRLNISNIGRGTSHYNWKGGRPKCLDCKKQLINYDAKRCNSCTRKLTATDNVGYSRVHKWLSQNFGKAFYCEMKDCGGVSKCFEWALKEGKEYKKIRANFWQLCKKCHIAYDHVIEKRVYA